MLAFGERRSFRPRKPDFPCGAATNAAKGREWASLGSLYFLSLSFTVFHGLQLLQERADDVNEADVLRMLDLGFDRQSCISALQVRRVLAEQTTSSFVVVAFCVVVVHLRSRGCENRHSTGRVVYIR